MFASFPKQLLKHSMIFTAGILSGALVVTYLMGSQLQANTAQSDIIMSIQSDVDQRCEVIKLSEFTFLSLTSKMGQLQGQLIGLNAQMEKIAKVHNVSIEQLEPTYFPTAYHLGQEVADMNLFSSLASLEYQLVKRAQQLNALEELSFLAQYQSNRIPRGKYHEVVNGWISSYFGTRTDPITKKRKWHSGVDIAGASGSEVKAIASGVVTFSGQKGGYGNLVEVNHGDNLVTRYAHNESLVANPGDVVQKGTVIAKRGTTGRTTGPNVHFEVRENGRAVDPGDYLPDMKKKV